MFLVRNSFLGQTNNRKGENDADDQVDNVSDERYEEGGGVRVVGDDLCRTVVHLHTAFTPNDTEKYPRPHQHNREDNQQDRVMDGVVRQRRRSWRLGIYN